MRRNPGIGLKWSITATCGPKTASRKKFRKIYEKSSCICPEISVIIQSWWVGGISSPLSLRVPQPAFFGRGFLERGFSFLSKGTDSSSMASIALPAQTLHDTVTERAKPSDLLQGRVHFRRPASASSERLLVRQLSSSPRIAMPQSQYDIRHTICDIRYLTSRLGASKNLPRRRQHCGRQKYLQNVAGNEGI